MGVEHAVLVRQREPESIVATPSGAATAARVAVCSSMPESLPPHETEWVTEHLAPAFRRLGFLRIDVTQGAHEYGRDLVIADIDRFGLLRHYGVQVKLNLRTAEVSGVLDQIARGHDVGYVDPVVGHEVTVSGMYLVVRDTLAPTVRKELIDRIGRSAHGRTTHFLDGQQVDAAAASLGRPHRDDRQAALMLAQIEVEGWLKRKLPPLAIALARARKPLSFHLALTIPRLSLSADRLHAAERFTLVDLKKRPDDISRLVSFVERVRWLDATIRAVPIGGLSLRIAPSLASAADEADALAKEIEPVLALLKELREMPAPRSLGFGLR